MQRQLKILHNTLNIYVDPTMLYNTLCGKNSILLESAEIVNKKGIKSLIVVDSALKIVSFGKTVQIKALTYNGSFLLPIISNNLNDRIEKMLTLNDLTLNFPDVNVNQDEDSKLKDVSILDAIRSIIKTINQFDNSKTSNIIIAGLFGYELINNFEDIPSLSPSNKCPEICFYLAETYIEIDHINKNTLLQVNIFSDDVAEYSRLNDKLFNIAKTLAQPLKDITTEQIANVNLTCNLSDDEYMQKVDDLKENIINGDVFQIVFSRYFSLKCSQPLNAYIKLKETNPSPYMFYMQDEDFTLFGSSPECALKYTKQNNQVELYPIAGTKPRGFDQHGNLNLDLDSRYELEMKMDQKELSEHTMLVDLARNDLARISEVGTRHTASLLNVDRYSHVMHLVSNVIGKLRKDLDGLHAYQATMNMGTLTGAPKVKAMKLIAEHEKTRRGSYGGAIGYLNNHGDIDTCIVIRSAYIEENTAYVQAGAGIVFDSVAKSEMLETKNKAKAVINAICLAHQAKGDL